MSEMHLNKQDLRMVLVDHLQETTTAATSTTTK